MKELRKGITLVQILVVVLIISVLLALLVPSFNESMRSAKETNLRSNLKQIGIALEMYVTDENGVGPKTLDQLAAYSNMQKESLMPSPLDGTEEGYANVYRKSKNGVRQGLAVAPYKLSHLTRRELEFGQTTELAFPNAKRKGWLISLAQSNEVTESTFMPNFYQGSYLRLCNDGSIVKRKFNWRNITVNGQTHNSVAVSEIFEDRNSR